MWDISRGAREPWHGLSRASYRKMMQNLWWAAGYNIGDDSRHVSRIAPYEDHIASLDDVGACADGDRDIRREQRRRVVHAVTDHGHAFAIPLAAGVLAARGILLPPAFAAVLMSASTVIVAINAQLLRGRQAVERPCP
jgi:hypothetical protein